MAGRGLHRRKSTFYRGEVSPGGARHRLYRGAMACLPEGSEISRLGLAFLVARRAVSKACPASAGQELTTKTNGAGAALRLHHVEFSASGLLPSCGGGGNGGAGTVAPRVRHSRSSLDRRHLIG